MGQISTPINLLKTLSTDKENILFREYISAFERLSKMLLENNLKRSIDLNNLPGNLREFFECEFWS